LDANGAGSALRFMRGNVNPWGNWFSKMTTVGAIGASVVAPYLAPAMFAAKAAWHGGWGVASMPAEITHGAVKTLRFIEKLGSNSGPDYASPVVDTRMAYTMRQSSLQAMHNSAYSLRGAIGNEARILHS